jgi:hypothetical protein
MKFARNVISMALIFSSSLHNLGATVPKVKIVSTNRKEKEHKQVFLCNWIKNGWVR